MLLKNQWVHDEMKRFFKKLPQNKWQCKHNYTEYVVHVYKWNITRL